MSEMNVYRKLKDLCDNNTKVDMSSNKLVEVDDELVEILVDYIANNFDTNELFSAFALDQTMAQIVSCRWLSRDNMVRDRFYRILRNDVGSEIVNNSGKYNVRLKKILKGKYGVKCFTEDDFCKLSTLFGDWKERNKLTFEFVDVFNWSDGDYGDEGSCYWGDRAAGRDTLENYDALAIRFYKTDADGDKVGVGRAWMAQILKRKDLDGAMVVFNRYGVPRGMNDVMAAIKTLDKDFMVTQVGLENAGSTHGPLYINGDAFAVSYEPLGRTYVDLGYQIHYGTYSEYCTDHNDCAECGNAVYEGDNYYGVEDDILCEECFDRLASRCYECNDNYYNNNMVSVQDGRVCAHCRDRYHYVECNNCSEYSRRGDTHETTQGDVLCEFCADDCDTCDHCHLVIDENSDNSNDAISTDRWDNEHGIKLCDSCNNDYTFVCSTCNRVMYDPDNNVEICINCNAEMENKCDEKISTQS